LLLSEIIDDLEVIGDHFCANWYISGENGVSGTWDWYQKMFVVSGKKIAKY
jgi:hypothetical protein